MLLNIQPDSRSATSGARESHYKSGSIMKLDVETLLAADTAVQVRVRKIVRFYDYPTLDSRTNKGWFRRCNEIGQVSNHLICAITIHILVIVASEERAAICAP